MSKQTALQWFLDKLPHSIETQFSEQIQEALQMEREQIEEAYGDGLNAHRVDFCNRNEYCQKTYGGQDE